MKQLKSFKYRIYPNSLQKQQLNQTFGCVRFVWNKLVEDFNSYSKYNNFNKKSLSSKILKDYDKYQFLNDVSACSIQKKERDLQETKKQYFSKNRKKKLGRPFFKKKGYNDSYRLDSKRFKLDQDNKKIKLEKINGFIKIKLDRTIDSNVVYKSITIKKNNLDEYYVSILVEIDIEYYKQTGEYIGIDLGLKDLFTLSNGNKINNFKIFYDNQVELKRQQKHLSRKVKGSNRYNKQRLKVAKIHKRIMNTKDFIYHNLSKQLVKDYDIICIEDLNISGMIKNRKLSKSIQDVSWSKLINMLEYKSKWYGKELIKVDRFYASSKICNCCGYKLETLSLYVRNWTCSSCLSEHDRDINAAKNILNEGLRLLNH